MNTAWRQAAADL